MIIEGIFIHERTGEPIDHEYLRLAVEFYGVVTVYSDDQLERIGVGHWICDVPFQRPGNAHYRWYNHDGAVSKDRLIHVHHTCLAGAR